MFKFWKVVLNTIAILGGCSALWMVTKTYFVEAILMSFGSLIIAAVANERSE